MHQGTCVGGPLDGLTYAVRSDQGFLAVDKPAGLAWVYRVNDDGAFEICTNDDESLVDPVTGARHLDPARAVAAAERPGIDVVAVPTAGEVEVEEVDDDAE